MLSWTSRNVSSPLHSGSSTRSHCCPLHACQTDSSIKHAYFSRTSSSHRQGSDDSKPAWVALSLYSSQWSSRAGGHHPAERTFLCSEPVKVTNSDSDSRRRERKYLIFFFLTANYLVYWRPLVISDFTACLLCCTSPSGSSRSKPPLKGPPVSLITIITTVGLQCVVQNKLAEPNWVLLHSPNLQQSDWLWTGWIDGHKK